jgi:TetR/AcrR family transcriptional regulator, mexJK operon transcriptional repressor
MRASKKSHSEATTPKQFLRPSDAAKHLAILTAARQHFFKVGFSAAAIEAIAEDAAVSKVTLYKHFGSKEKLMSVVIAREVDSMSQLLGQQMGQGETLRERLLSYGEGMLTFLYRPEIIRFERLIGGEMERDAAIGERFLAAGPRPLRDALAKLLREGAAREPYQFKDLQAAADLLGGMIKGFEDVERRFGRPSTRQASINRKRVRFAVDAFLRAFAKP